MVVVVVMPCGGVDRDEGRRGFLLRLTWDASAKINDQNHVAMATTCGGWGGYSS